MEIYYYNKNNIVSIRRFRDCGPIFGGGYAFDIKKQIAGFSLSNNCDKNNYSNDSSNIFYNTNGKQYALAGTSYFYVENYEVYQINLDDN